MYVYNLVEILIIVWIYSTLAETMFCSLSQIRNKINHSLGI